MKHAIAISIAAALVLSGCTHTTPKRHDGKGETPDMTQARSAPESPPSGKERPTRPDPMPKENFFDGQSKTKAKR